MWHLSWPNNPVVFYFDARHPSESTQSSFIGLQEAKPRWVLTVCDSPTLIHDLWPGAQAPLSPLLACPLCSEALGWRAVAWGPYEVMTAGALGHLAVTGINETHMENEITKLRRRKPERRITEHELLPPRFQRAEPGGHTCTRKPADIRNTGADGDVAAVQSHFWRLGLPLLPVRKDICQAVALSPVGFRSKESIQEINDIILICSRIITRVFKTDSLNISAKEKSIF